jgi:ankyrin repeat protein
MFWDTKVEKLLSEAALGNLNEVRRLIEEEHVSVNATLKYKFSPCNLRHAVFQVPAGTTALSVAVRHQQLAVFNYLMGRHDIRCDLRNQAGATPFYYVLHPIMIPAPHRDVMAVALLNKRVNYFISDPNDHKKNIVLFKVIGDLPETTSWLLDNARDIALDAKTRLEVASRGAIVDLVVNPLKFAIYRQDNAAVAKILARYETDAPDGFGDKLKLTEEEFIFACRHSSAAVIYTIYQNITTRPVLPEWFSVVKLLYLVISRTNNNVSDIESNYNPMTTSKLLDILPRDQIVTKFNEEITGTLGHWGHAEQGQTLLFTAAFYNRVDCIDQLLALGLDIAAVDAKGNTPMITAVKGNALGVVKKLHQIDETLIAFEVTQNSEAQTLHLGNALFFATQNYEFNRELVEFLLFNTNSSVINNIYGSDKLTAFVNVARNADITLLQKFLDKGALGFVTGKSPYYNFETSNWSAIHALVVRGDLEALCFMLDLAEQQADKENISRILTDEFAYKTDYRYRVQANLLLVLLNRRQVALQHERFRTQAVHHLLKYCDVNSIFKNIPGNTESELAGRTAIGLAVEHNLHDALKVLIAAGANLQVDDYNFAYSGSRALNKSTKNDRSTYLPGLQNYSSLPLKLSLITLAAIRLARESLEILLNHPSYTAERKADLINQPLENINQCTALMLLAMCTQEWHGNKVVSLQDKNIKIAELLIAHGADLSKLSNENMTAADYAREFRQPRLAEVLQPPREECQMRSVSMKMLCG